MKSSISKFWKNWRYPVMVALFLPLIAISFIMVNPFGREKARASVPPATVYGTDNTIDFDNGKYGVVFDALLGGLAPYFSSFSFDLSFSVSGGFIALSPSFSGVGGQFNVAILTVSGLSTIPLYTVNNILATGSVSNSFGGMLYCGQYNDLPVFLFYLYVDDNGVGSSFSFNAGYLSINSAVLSVLNVHTFSAGSGAGFDFSSFLLSYASAERLSYSYAFNTFVSGHDYDNGYSVGFGAGYNEGYLFGTSTGVSSGYVSGYADGVASVDVGDTSEPYLRGYNFGYLQGEQVSLADTGILAFIPNILGAFGNFLLVLDNFDMWGISVLDIVSIAAMFAIGKIVLSVIF